MSALRDLLHSIEYDPTWPEPHYCNECDVALSYGKDCPHNYALRTVLREQWRIGYIAGFKRAGNYIRGGAA